MGPWVEGGEEPRGVGPGDRTDAGEKAEKRAGSLKKGGFLFRGADPKVRGRNQKKKKGKQTFWPDS